MAFGDQVRITVVDDSRWRPHPSNAMKRSTGAKVRRICSEGEVGYSRFPWPLHRFRALLFPRTQWPAVRSSASMRTADTLQWGIMAMHLEPDEILVVLDADLIPMRRVDLGAKLDSCDFIYRSQVRDGQSFLVEYPWNGYFISQASLVRGAPDFHWDIDEIDGASCDTGGALAGWLRRHRARGNSIECLSSGAWDWREWKDTIPEELHDFLEFDRQQAGGRNFSEILDRDWLHMRAGGNWGGEAIASHHARLDRFTSAANQLVLKGL